MRYKFTIEYDGTNFHGWQRQPDVRTVEEEVEHALAKLYRRPIDIIGQGRTDAGVHARGQTAHADLPGSYKTERIAHAMKGLLPVDIVIRSVELCRDDFHARFDAASRSYSYHITTKPAAIFRNCQWYCYLNPDPDILAVCSEKISGTHDFVNFCIPPEEKMQTTTCTISESKWLISNGDERLSYHITGNRFLRHMVRRLVGAMVHTAAGKMSAGQFTELLNGAEVRQKAHSAPALGLILESVQY